MASSSSSMGNHTRRPREQSPEDEGLWLLDLRRKGPEAAAWRSSSPLTGEEGRLGKAELVPRQRSRGARLETQAKKETSVIRAERAASIWLEGRAAKERERERKNIHPHR
jgi:hypothetical protein